MHFKFRLLSIFLLAVQILCTSKTTALADDFDDFDDFMEDEKPAVTQPEPAKKTDTKTKLPQPSKQETTESKNEEEMLSAISKLWSKKSNEEEKKAAATPQISSKKAAAKRKLLPKERPTAKALAANLDLLTKVRQGLPFSTEEMENWILNAQDINYCYENGQTMLLYLVARYADTESLRLLIDNGADLQTHCTPRYEALFVAAINNPSAEIIDMLATNGANIVERDPEKNTAVILASTFNSSPKVITTLIDYGLRAETNNRYGYNSLMLAAYENGRIPIIETLLENEANINSTDPEGHTPLMAAAIRGRDDVMQHLIRRGADFKAVDKQGISVLDYYNKRYYLKTLNFEISPIASPSDRLAAQFKFIAEKHFAYNNALRQAPYSNNPEAATADAIKNLADIDVADEYGCTPFLNAVRQNNPLSVLEQYYNAKANINATCRSSQNALMFLAPHANENATPEQQIGKLKYLIRHQIDINATDDNGYSALMYALANRADAQFISTLLKAGADVNISSHDGETPLWIGLRQQVSAETIKLLLEYGARVNQKNARREIPLWYQLRTNGNPDLTILLVRGGADTSIKNPDGETPLWYTLHQQMSPELTNEIIQKEVDINQKDNNGDTPLLYAVKNNYPPQTIKLLLENGANPEIGDANGYTMYDILQNSQFFDETLKKRNRENILNNWE